MKSRILFLVACLLVGWMASPLVAAPAKAAQFRAGAATSNITPFLGGASSAIRALPATHVHDELHAKCLVLDDGKTKLAWWFWTCWASMPSVSTEARKLIQESVGLPPEQVLIWRHPHPFGRLRPWTNIITKDDDGQLPEFHSPAVSPTA